MYLVCTPGVHCIITDYVTLRVLNHRPRTFLSMVARELYLRNHHNYCNKANTILNAFARVVNKPNPGVLSTKAAKPQMQQFTTFKFKKLTRVFISGPEFLTMFVSRLGKDSNGELLLVANVQL